MRASQPFRGRRRSPHGHRDTGRRGSQCQGGRQFRFVAANLLDAFDAPIACPVIAEEADRRAGGGKCGLVDLKRRFRHVDRNGLQLGCMAVVHGENRNRCYPLAAPNPAIPQAGDGEWMAALTPSPCGRGFGEGRALRHALLHEPVEHALVSRLVERHVQPVVLRRRHRAVAEFLVEHPRADRDRVGPRRPRRLLPGLDRPRAPRHQRELAGECRRRQHPRIARQRGRAGPLHIGVRQFVDEPAGDAALPVGIDPPVRGMADDRPPARPGQADIGEPPLLLQRLHPALVQRALVGEQPLLPARQEHGVELQPLGAVQRHQADAVAFGVLVVLHHQRRRGRGTPPASRNPPAREPVPSGSPAAPAPRAICPAATSSV